MRGVMITGGAMLVQQFNWILYVFGAFLILTGVRMLKSTKKVDPAKNPVLRITRRFLPMTQHFDGGRFITRLNGRRALTPLALALVTVESADVVFAVDSIPTIFAITDIPFIIFTSNVFAILGLRSLFFALAGMMDRFHYLSVSLAVLLVLIGVKMLLKDALHAIPGLTYWTLGLVVAVLAAGIAASLLRDAARRRAKR
jgi:tellurite resistance protein TerC